MWAPLHCTGQLHFSKSFFRDTVLNASKPIIFLQFSFFGLQLKKGTKIYWTVSRIYYFSGILVVQQNQDLQTWFLLWTSFKEKLESWLNSHTRNISQYHPHNTPLTNTFDHLEYWLDSKVDIWVWAETLPGLDWKWDIWKWKDRVWSACKGW